MTSAVMLSEAFRRFHAGEALSDDDVESMITFLQPMEYDGWVLDQRFSFFVAEIREMANRLRGFMNSRIASGHWRARTALNPPFTLPSIPTEEETPKPDLGDDSPRFLTSLASRAKKASTG